MGGIKMDSVIVYNANGENKARFFYYKENAKVYVKFLQDLGYSYKAFEYDGEKFNPIDLD